MAASNDKTLDIEIVAENSRNMVNGNDLSIQIGEVRSLSSDNLGTTRLVPKILQKKGDRSTFLKRLGMTNKNLYEEYLQFKKKNNGKPIVGTLGSKSKTKYITPTKYKKPEDRVVKSSQPSNKKPVHEGLSKKFNDILHNTLVTAPLSTNSAVHNSERTVYTKSPESSKICGNNSVKKPITHTLQVENDPVPRTTTASCSTTLPNVESLIVMEHPIVSSSASSDIQLFSSFSNAISELPSNSTVGISELVSVVNNSPTDRDMNPVVKLKRLDFGEPDTNSIVYIDVDEPIIPSKSVPRTNNKNKAIRNLSQAFSKSASKRIENPIALNNELLGFPPTCTSSLANNTISSTTMSTDPVKHNLLMQPKTFGNMKTKTEMGQYIKQIQETITAINGVIGVPTIANKGTNPKSGSSAGQKPAKKTFRDKATMVNNKKQVINMNKRLSRIKKKNEMLKTKIKNMQKQLNERRKPFYEQIDKIEKMKNLGNAQAIFLMEQINNFDKKMVKFSFENMTIFTVLLKRSQKGYQFLQHYNILGMPSTSTIRRFVNKDGNFQDKYVDEHLND